MIGLGVVVRAAREGLTAGLPWPEGDPEGLEGAARSAGETAGLLRERGTALEGAGSTAAGWKGEAAQAFRVAVGDLNDEMARGAGALADAAAALSRLARVVSEAQELVLRLAEEVQEAEEEARQASERAAVAGVEATAKAAHLALAGDDASPALKSAARSAADDAASAESRASAAAERAREVRQRATRRAEDACADVRRADRATAAVVEEAAARAPLAGVRAGTPTPANTFAVVALADLSLEQWHRVAYWRAGIDPAGWNVQRGLFANDQIVQAVYTYYGRLFLEHPELQWAGMAAVAGPGFYGAWQDIYVLRHVVDPAERAKYIRELFGTPLLLSGPFSVPGHLASEELEWFEKRFLTMQREIFDDLAWKHEAYAMGGIALMRALETRRLIENTELAAWEDIASGDRGRVAAGNKELLRREQYRIIQDDYDAMRRRHGPVGDAFTYTMTAIAEMPVPGSRPYRDVSPLTVHVDPTPPVFGWDPPPSGANVPTPLPRGNIAVYDDRWQWIESDLLPAYQNLDPAAVRAIVSTPVSDRAHAARKLPDLPYPGGD